MKPLPSARPHGSRWLLPARVRGSIGTMMGLGLLLPASLLAAGEARRSFDIPPGDAVATLKAFATQSNAQLLYSPDDVSGIKTRAVQGEFSSFAALNEMLRTTPLRAQQDEKTKAISITVNPPTRAPPSSKPPSPPSSSAPTPSTLSSSPPLPATGSSTMKKRGVLSFLASFLTLGLSGTAQTAGSRSNTGVSAAVEAGSAADVRQTGAVTGRVKNIATGQYLNNARVSIRGSDFAAQTDQFGVFRIVGAPSGTAVLEVFYTGLDPWSTHVAIPAGGSVEQDAELTNVARYGRVSNTVKLDAFVVTANSETDAQAIAVNEQRFAANIKNVMSTDALGDVLGSSAGEFMKFLPGVTAEFEDMDIIGISVRGMGAAMTAITTDGAPVSSTSSALTRSVDIRGMALNDISRIELTKVPTPATPADSLAGSVNMISKSAFERSDRQFRYGINLSANHENLTLKRTPTPHFDHKTYKILPGVTFDFSWPISKTFGIVITGLSNTTYNELHSTANTWTNAGSGTNAVAASTVNPFVSNYQLSDGPRIVTLNTFSLKADWKVTEHSVFSLGQTANWTATRIGTLQYTFLTGTVGTPTLASGVPMTWGPTFTRGATGRGSLLTNTINQTADYTTEGTNLRYRYDDGRWKIETGFSRSASSTERRSMDNPNSEYFFLSTTGIVNRSIRVEFSGIDPDKPGKIEVFDDRNQPVDWRSLSSFRGNQAINSPLTNQRKDNRGFLDVRRRLGLLPFPTALQAGISQRVETADASIQNNVMNFMGPDGASTTTAPLEPYAMQVYRNQDSHYGFRDIEWLSPTRAWRAYHLNPKLYAATPAQQVAAENFRIDNYEFIKETVRAGYIEAESDLLNNRLRVLTGVRFERTNDQGQGALTDADAVWQRDAKGAFIRNAAGARIRKPEAGAVNSMEQLRLTRTARGALSNRTYQGYYPSLHVTYNAGESLLVRAAYAKTYGRPEFSDVIPRTVASSFDLAEDEEPDPLVGRGTLSVRNASLRPWTANNFDLSTEYYTSQGGLFSAGVFLKKIKNFFGTSARIATAADVAELGLDPAYAGWSLLTKFNSGDAQIKGAEFNLKHSLGALGHWGSYFTIFGNATKLELSGNPGASFTSFIPLSGNWGGSFHRKRFSMTARWNYRGLDKRTPQAAYGPDGYEYFKARTTIDMNASYQLTRRLSVAGSVNNILNVPQTLLRFGSATPEYARQYREREYGIRMAVGLRGTF